MLRNQGIRTKLLAVLALPIVALIVVTTIVSLQTFDQARQARQVEKLATGADTLGALVTSLQAERSVTASFLAKRPVRDEMLAARKASDKALETTKAFLAGVDISALSSQAKAGLALATDNNAQLGNVRKQVDTGYAQPDRIADRYTTIIGADIALPARIGDGLSDRTIGAQLGVYSNAQLLAELATQERELGLSIIANREVDPISATNLAQLAVQQSQTSMQFRQDATTDEISDLDDAIYLPVQSRAQFSTMQAQLLSLSVGAKVSMDSSNWRVASNDRLSALQKLSTPIAHSTASAAAAKSSSASNRALLMLIGSGLLVLILIGLGLTLARGITRPLRHLTQVAGDIADELPRMVERMATPGTGPGLALPEIPVNSRDEVGQLAEAFKDVNATTIRVAEEQAALRASIAEMFVNVARRNHVLLSRQLSFIDQLERTEENPDTLDNLFRLDHLATRMRRNAESLIVLAGIDAGRRLRRPMPLSDVIRTAVSEIERYDRVDLALQIDPPMVGHVALSTAHLLAELLENATQFSNPDTRVIASTALTARGVRITITDLGLGMTWDEINEANQRIAAPPSTEVVGSQRLGFYVVGRLARRLDSVVELKPGRAQGTVVTIDLPPALFVSGSVPQAGPAPLIAAEPLAADPVDADTSSEDEVPVADVTVVEGEPASEEQEAPAAASNGLPARPVASAPTALRQGTATGDGDRNLPRRSASTPPTVAPVTASGSSAPVGPDASSAPRSGIFSNFRSRRAVESEVGSIPSAGAAKSLEELATQLPEFVPTLDTATPTLPQRGEQATPTASGLPSRGQRNGVDGASEVSTPVEPQTNAIPVDMAALDTVVEPIGLAPADEQVDVQDEPADLFDLPVAEPVAPDTAADHDWSASSWSQFADESDLSAVDGLGSMDSLAVPSLEPMDVPALADEPAEAEPFAVPGLADEPFAVPGLADEPVVGPVVGSVAAVTEPVAHEHDDGDIDAEHIDAEHIDAEQVDAEHVETWHISSEHISSEHISSEHIDSEQVEAEQVDAGHTGFQVPDGVQARSTLSELARETTPVVGQEPEMPAAPAIPVGTPAMDILPGRHGGRGLRLRRTSRPRAVSPHVEMEQVHAPIHPAEPTHAAPRHAENTPLEPVASATTSPFGGAPSPFGSVPSPFGSASGSFGSAPSAPDGSHEVSPAAVAGPIAAPSSLFAPAPAAVQSSEPTPAFPPTALPALAAAQSLRERSAMAAEALSELSALSSYRPESLAAEAHGPTLTRRTPQATPAAQIAAPQEPQGVRRANRSAADVRTMLSGFRAGVERGRTSPTATQHGAAEAAPMSERAEP